MSAVKKADTISHQVTIREDMSNEEYHSIDGISSSAVKAVYKKSLAHWKGQKIVQSAAFAMGNAVHANLLEKDKNLVIKGPKTKNVFLPFYKSNIFFCSSRPGNVWRTNFIYN